MALEARHALGDAGCLGLLGSAHGQILWSQDIWFSIYSTARDGTWPIEARLSPRSRRVALVRGALKGRRGLGRVLLPTLLGGGLGPPDELPQGAPEVAGPAVRVLAEAAVLVECLLGLRHVDHRRDRQAAELGEEGAHCHCGPGAAPLAGGVGDDGAGLEGEQRAAEVVAQVRVRRAHGVVVLGA